MPVHLCHGSRFYGLSGVHDENAVGDFRDNAEIVGDEDDGSAGIAADGGEEVEDLDLDGGVECCGGFVAEDDVGVVGDRHGDHDALTHSAGEFVGVGVGEAFRVGDADPAEEGDYAVFDLGAGESGLVEAEGFCQVEADGVDGGEGG